MVKFGLILGALAGLIVAYAPQAGAQDDKKLKQEYVRFAHLYSMDWGSSVNRSYQMRTATRRAQLLAAERFTDPTLRKAASDFDVVSKHYGRSWEERNNTQMTKGEYERRMGVLGTLPFKSDEEFIKTLGDELKRAKDTENKIWEAGRKGFFARASHAQSWREVLPLAKKFAGPKSDRFPLRLGVTFLHNTSGAALTNLTIAIETNSCVELPGKRRLHVVFFERLDAGEWHGLPEWLVNKLWKGNTYVPGRDVLRCSLWCDQMRVEDVVFDLKDLPAPNGQDGYRWGLFPDNTFKGSYDTKTPWTVPPLPANRFKFTVAGGIWKGKDNATQIACELVVFDLAGPNFIANYMTDGGKSERLGEGRIQDGKIDWQPMVAHKGELGDPHWGTIKDGRMELSYGKNRVAKGTVSLLFTERKKSPKGK